MYKGTSCGSVKLGGVPYDNPEKRVDHAVKRVETEREIGSKLEPRAARMSRGRGGSISACKPD
jgi:hypothetical protein